MNANAPAQSPLAGMELFTLHADELGEPTPGRIARALHHTFGIPADALLAIIPEKPGLLLVAISRQAAARIATPVTLPLPPDPGQVGAIAQLRRPSDPTPLPAWRAVLRWDDGAPAPAPGAIAAALDGESGLRIFGEDLGPLRPSGTTVALTLSPTGLPWSGERELVVAGRPMRLLLAPALP